tara:strand:+ start:202 stop:342 length:141 start_codon:yes stop_codon:yes gene_type:complete
MTNIELQILFKNLCEIERLLKYEDIYRAKKVLTSAKKIVKKSLKNK